MHCSFSLSVDLQGWAARDRRVRLVMEALENGGETAWLGRQEQRGAGVLADQGDEPESEQLLDRESGVALADPRTMLMRSAS
jgi:hypothetical protein